ncbi:FtsX-like permease family protein [Tardisphaera saccharovorans]
MKSKILVLAILALTVLGMEVSSAQSAGSSAYLSGAVNSLSVSQIREYAKQLSSISTRVTGYQGNLEAAKLIEYALRQDGVKVVNESFKAAVPVDTGSWVYVPSEHQNLTAYALWPNGPVPGWTQGYVSGRLVYVGNGTLSDMDGKVIKGSVVLENFNSGANWLYAAELGAKAVIFLAPENTTSLESRVKANPDPLYLPRLYVQGSAASELLKVAQGQGIVYLHDGMRWENVTSYNIIGIINGTVSPQNIIIASAHYDSWSVVPAIAPGGQDALAISTLLDLAKYFSQNRPANTLWIVAYSGYWEGLVGPYAFVHEYLYSSSNMRGTTKIWMDIDLDLSSGSSSLDALNYGFFTGYDMGSYAETKYQSYLEPEADQFIQEAGLNLNLSTGLPAVRFYMHGAEDWGTQPTFYMLDVEPIVQTNTLGFTLRTSFDQRTTWLTPLNNLGYTNWDNVVQQARTAAAIIAGFANSEDLGISWSSDAPAVIGTVPGAYVGFVTVDVRTVEFSPNTSWYAPVPDSLLQVPMGPAQNPDWWEFGSQWYITNANGSLDYYGAIPYTSKSFLAWKINGSTGQLDYAPNYGVYGTAQGVSGGLATSIPDVVYQPSYISIPMFQAEPVTAFNILDTRTMSPAEIYDPRDTYLTFFSEPAVMGVYKETTRAAPTFWGLYYDPATTVATAFVQKGENIVLTYDPNPVQVGPLIILDNASTSEPRGAGYLINGPYEITDTFYQQAQDMYLLVEERYAKLESHYATSPGLVQLMAKAKIYLNYAHDNLTELNYAAAYNDSLVSLAYSSQAYSTQLMPMYGQISGSMIFFTFLIIPFAYFFEELTFHFSGFKRIIALFAIIGVLLYVFSFINPSLAVISNSTMTVLGVGLLIFALFIIWVFYGEIREVLQQGAETRLGAHQVTGSTGAASLHAASTAVANMRRRPLMTALTLATIVIFAAGNVALTSTSSGIGIAKTGVPSVGVPPQQAIVVKWYHGMPPQVMGDQMMNYLKGIGGNAFYYWPTYLYYPTLIYKVGVYSLETALPVQVEGTNQTSIQMLAFMGIPSGEASQFFSKFIISGTANVTGHGVIVPQELAQQMNIRVGQEVNFYGVGEFTVVGIMSNNVTGSGYDGFPILPISPFYNSAADEGYSTAYSSVSLPEPVLPSQFVVIDWKVAKDLGGFLSSVELVPKYPMNETQLESYAELMRYPITPSVYVGHGSSGGQRGSVISLSVISTYSLLGFSLTVALLLIAALAILNALYENVQIRRREIYTYASLGLSPSGASMMFVTEALVYALIGAVLGFLLGFFLDYVFISSHMLPSSFTFNFTSWSMLVSLLMILVATLAGAVYPSRISSRLITPSLSRRWRPTSRAKGTEWSIELPMKLSKKEETIGVLRYLREYYAGVGYEKPSFRVDEEPVLDEAAAKLTVKIRLAPLEMGISQLVTLDFVQGATMDYTLFANLKLLTGDPGLWQARSAPFLDDLRAQVLLWRTLRPEQREKYISGGSPA